jgi:hypothetical protein
MKNQMRIGASLFLILISLMGWSAQALAWPFSESSKITSYVQSRCVQGGSALQPIPVGIRQQLSASQTSAVHILKKHLERSQLEHQALVCLTNYFNENGLGSKKLSEIFVDQRGASAAMLKIRNALTAAKSSMSAEEIQRAERLAVLTHGFNHAAQIRPLSDFNIDQYFKYEQRKLQEEFDKQAGESLNTLGIKELNLVSLIEGVKPSSPQSTTVQKGLQ